MFSPKLEIINHFDELINKLDIEFEQCLRKHHNQNQLIDFTKWFQDENIRSERIRFGYDHRFVIYFFDYSLRKSKEQKEDLWSEPTKIVDYLNHVRMRTIEELRNEQKERVENSSEFSYLKVEISDEKQKEELKSQLFADKFYFQVRTTIKRWYFNIYTFVTDFYMSPSDITLLE